MQLPLRQAVGRAIMDQTIPVTARIGTKDNVVAVVYRLPCLTIKDSQFRMNPRCSALPDTQGRPDVSPALEHKVVNLQG